jgi:hypothetical protein
MKLFGLDILREQVDEWAITTDAKAKNNYNTEVVHAAETDRAVNPLNVKIIIIMGVAGTIT